MEIIQILENDSTGFYFLPERVIIMITSFVLINHHMILEREVVCNNNEVMEG